MNQPASKRKEEMTAPSLLEGLIYPERKRAYRRYKEKLLQNLKDKKKIAKEKAKNGATDVEIRAAYGDAWKAEAMARKHIKG